MRFRALLFSLCAVFALSAQSEREAVDRITNALDPRYRIAGETTPKLALAEACSQYSTPQISVAVVRSGKLAWARGFGGAHPETLFQAASISKPVAAAVALRLVEEGRLALDEDVNNRLKSWKVPENEFTHQQKVTLRRLLSHSAGLTVHGFRGYAAGEPVPSLQQLLDGQKPANSAAVRVNVAPGSLWRYAGGGYEVTQLLMEETTGESFSALARRLVLDPARMKHSTYEQPLPANRHKDAARGHRGDGKPVSGNWHTYPEMAAAGLWTTPSDLARFAIEVWKASRGTPSKLLRKETAAEMLRVQSGSYGLGFALSGEGPKATFSHGGANEGFRCNLIMFRDGGDGVAVMTNGDNGDSVARMVIRTLASVYSWPGFEPQERRRIALSPAALVEYTGVYEFSPVMRLEVTIENGRVMAAAPRVPKAELFPESETQFFSLAEHMPPVEFIKNDSGKIAAARVFGQRGSKVK